MIPVVFTSMIHNSYKNFLPDSWFTKTFDHHVLDCKTVRIFAYSSTREQSNKISGTRLKTETQPGEDWGEALFSRASHALRTCKARALHARKTLTPNFTDFLTDFEKKNPTVLQFIWSPIHWMIFTVATQSGFVKFLWCSNFSFHPGLCRFWTTVSRNHHSFGPGIESFVTEH